jgi:LPXTG-motif cell wall-anchored protein
MPLRVGIAYGLIAIIVIAAILGVVVYRRKRKEARRMARGGHPRRR